VTVTMTVNVETWWKSLRRKDCLDLCCILTGLPTCGSRCCSTVYHTICEHITHTFSALVDCLHWLCMGHWTSRFSGDANASLRVSGGGGNHHPIAIMCMMHCIHTKKKIASQIVLSAHSFFFTIDSEYRILEFSTGEFFMFVLEQSQLSLSLLFLLTDSMVSLSIHIQRSLVVRHEVCHCYRSPSTNLSDSR